MENRHVAGAARLAIVAALFLLWEGLARFGAVNPRMLPPASDVLATLWDLLQRARIHSDIAVTLLELVVSFAISVPVGVVLGIVIAESRFLSAVFKPLLFFLLQHSRSRCSCRCSSSPSASASPRRSRSASSSLTTAICTAAAVESIRADHVMIARRFGATRAQIVRRVDLLEHAAAADRGAAHLDDLHLHGRRARRDVRLAPRHPATRSPTGARPIRCARCSPACCWCR